LIVATAPVDVVVPRKVIEMTLGARGDKPRWKDKRPSWRNPHGVFGLAPEATTVEVEEVGPVVSTESPATRTPEILREQERRDTSCTAV
jgi:hypothetical protein